MTPKEFFYAVKYHNKEREQEAQLQYEVARYMLRHMWNMQGRQLKRMLKELKDVDVFPWEKDTQKAQTPEQMATALKMIFRSYKNKKDKDKEKKHKPPRKR